MRHYDIYVKPPEYHIVLNTTSEHQTETPVQSFTKTQTGNGISCIPSLDITALQMS